MTSIEISCVLEAATDATLLACFAQDHRSGMVVICSAPDKVVLSGAAAENAFNVSNYIATHLRNPELIKFYSAYGGQAPAFLSAELAEMAKTANLPSCALAQYYKDMIDPQHP